MQKTTTRWLAVTSKASIFTFSLIGQAIGCASIFTESFVESQKKPGAEKFVGFSGTGEMQTEPNSDSADSAGLNRTTTDRIMMLILDDSNSLEEVDASGNLVARYTQTQRIDEPLAIQCGVTY